MYFLNCCLIAGMAVMLGLLPLGALAADSPGEQSFLKHCASCHQVGGVGLTGLAPPLTIHKASSLGARTLLPGGREYIPRVMLYGLVGLIEVGGERFSGLMPSFSQIEDIELAGIANYLIRSLNETVVPSEFLAYSAEDFAASRGKGMRQVDMYKMRRNMEKQVTAATNEGGR